MTDTDKEIRMTDYQVLAEFRYQIRSFMLEHSHE